MCEEYEETLKEANRLMEECGYTGFFRWEGRQEDYEVEVMRLRTVQEKVTVTVSMPKGSTDDDVIQEAYELAEGETDDSWEENDSSWGTRCKAVVSSRARPSPRSAPRQATPYLAGGFLRACDVPIRDAPDTYYPRFSFAVTCSQTRFPCFADAVFSSVYSCPFGH